MIERPVNAADTQADHLDAGAVGVMAAQDFEGFLEGFGRVLGRHRQPHILDERPFGDAAIVRNRAGHADAGGADFPGRFQHVDQTGHVDVVIPAGVRPCNAGTAR